jgi:hemoglobin
LSTNCGWKDATVTSSLSKSVLMPAVAVLLLACASSALASADAGTPSLYARMGGDPVVRAVVDDLIDEAASDPRTSRSFAKVDLKRLKRLLTEQICDLSGGGCKYSGDSMHDVHAGLGITQAEFYSMVTMLRKDLRRHGVALRERNELLAILAPMKRDVVER